MGTRGAIGFYKEGNEKVCYNHFDSYPTGLGDDLISYLKGKTINELNSICDEIKLSDDYVKGGGFSIENGFSKSFEDYRTFLANSVFCQYAYIINLDDKVVEFYSGINHNPEAKGRYAHLKCDGWDMEGVYGVKLRKKIPLSKFLKGKVKVSESGETFVVC